MKLFTLDDSYTVVIEPQAALLQPFAALIERDRTKSKRIAKKEIGYVWFFIDIASDFAVYGDLKEREKAIKQDLKMGKDWEPDELVEAAIEYYKEMSSSLTASILRRSRYTADKLSEKLETAVKDDDLSIDEMGKILASINKMPDVINSLQKAEKAVLKEIDEAQDRLGAREKAEFEDGI